MQVIGLVNTLLAKDRDGLSRRLHQQRYTVVPLAPDVGLIGWMSGTDPLQNLIIDYRQSHKILSDLEHRLILHVSILPQTHILVIPPNANVYLRRMNPSMTIMRRYRLVVNWKCSNLSWNEPQVKIFIGLSG